MRLSTKLLLISELVLLVLVFALLIPVRSNMRAQVIEDLQNELRAIASTAVIHINGDTHQEVHENPDPSNPAFLQLREQLRAIRDANGLTKDHIYTFYFTNDNSLRFGVMTHPSPFIGDTYTGKTHHREAVLSGLTAVSDLYEDVNGEWISAAAPIKDTQGKLVGLLEVTQPSDAYFARYNRLAMINMVIALLGLSVSSLLGYIVLSRLVIGPVEEIQIGLRALGDHNFGHRVNIQTKDEFQDLGTLLNTLFEQLNTARSIQDGFYPKELPSCNGYQMAGASEPCDATGGDYYDAFKLDDGRTAIVMADVTGHGLGPSLIMATCRAALHALAHSGVDPGELLDRLEKHLAPDLIDGRFITMILGVLHEDGRFVYANAGHAPAILRNGDEMRHLESHRPPLGVIIPLDEDDEIQSAVQLGTGDRILLASDGVNEAQNPEHKQFGFEPLFELMKDLKIDSAGFVAALRTMVANHRNGRRASDDFTILCIDRTDVTATSG